MRTLAEAALDASTCTKCRLSQGRTQVVYGVGDPSADLMFIGEAPGFHEDKQGEPFVGAAGQLLNQLLSEIEIPRSDVYINNVILGMDPVGLRAPNAAATGTVLPTGQVIGGAAAPVREVIERCGAIPMPSPAPPGRRNAVELPRRRRQRGARGGRSAYLVWNYTGLHDSGNVPPAVDGSVTIDETAQGGPGPCRPAATSCTTS
jgi:Uracil DNA glycosylase superfamily